MCEKVNFIKHVKNIHKAAISIMAAFFLIVGFSCNEENTTSTQTKNDSIVSTRIFNAKFTIKDSGYTQIKVTSPIVEMYELIDTPFTLFPKGLELNYFKEKATRPGYLRASYAKIVEKKGWYEAQGNVLVINDEGDSLKTQQLFWNKNTKRIFSPDTTTIILKDGTINVAAHGMKASDNFKEFEFLINSGNIYVKD